MIPILAAFEHRQLAARAVERLAQAGIPRDRMLVEHELERLHGPDRSKATGTDSVLGSIGRMFADLVQTNVDPHHADLMAQAVQRGAAVLVVQAEPAQVEATAKALREAGAFNVSVQGAVGQAH